MIVKACVVTGELLQSALNHMNADVFVAFTFTRIGSGTPATICVQLLSISENLSERAYTITFAGNDWLSLIE